MFTHGICRNDSSDRVKRTQTDRRAFLSTVNVLFRPVMYPDISKLGPHPYKTHLASACAWNAGTIPRLVVGCGLWLDLQHEVLWGHVIRTWCPHNKLLSHLEGWSTHLRAVIWPTPHQPCELKLNVAYWVFQVSGLEPNRVLTTWVQNYKLIPCLCKNINNIIHLQSQIILHHYPTCLQSHTQTRGKICERGQ